MFLFFILSSARWPHLCSIAQGTSGFGCFMTQCCSLRRQCCDLKHCVRTVIYSCLWPKCCCCWGSAPALVGAEGRAWLNAELLLLFHPLEPVSSLCLSTLVPTVKYSCQAVVIASHWNFLSCEFCFTHCPFSFTLAHIMNLCCWE